MKSLPAEAPQYGINFKASSDVTECTPGKARSPFLPEVGRFLRLLDLYKSGASRCHVSGACTGWLMNLQLEVWLCQ